MKIAAWNVNSVRARLPHLLKWLEETGTDVTLLQETKTTDETFPFDDLQKAGYEVAHHGQKSYNGVAIVSKLPLSDVVLGMPDRVDAQARVIAATVQHKEESLRVVSVYAPNGQSLESDKFQYKLQWFADFYKYLTAAREEYGTVVAGGDYNITPADEDIYDAEEWGLDIAASPQERKALQKLYSAGFADAHRLFPQPERSFSWWDYRAAAFRRNRGLRIDLMLVSDSFVAECKSCAPDKTPRTWERPSDHAPIVAEFC
ncbi:MAG: exodeoxyribonuclease III [Gammaproteobacteria bacterium WSBS_2016_MAG_OTU1]